MNGEHRIVLKNTLPCSDDPFAPLPLPPSVDQPELFMVGWVKVAKAYGGSSQTDQPVRSGCVTKRYVD